MNDQEDKKKRTAERRRGCSRLGRYGIPLAGVFDTLRVSRRLRGTKIDGGHSLKVVCARELGVQLDKSEQVSDWARRPRASVRRPRARPSSPARLSLCNFIGE